MVDWRPYTYAGLARCCSLMVALIGLLRRWRMGIVVLQPGLEHVGNNGGSESGIERVDAVVHPSRSERFATAQQLVVDGAKLIEDVAYLPVVGQVVLHLFVMGLRNVVHLRACAGATDR